MRAKLQLLASDAAIYGLTTLLTRSMSFLLTPLYTHYLSSRADFGIYSYLYSLLAFINVLYSFGLDTAFLRFFDKDNKNTTKFRDIVCSIYIDAKENYLLTYRNYTKTINFNNTVVVSVYSTL